MLTLLICIPLAVSIFAALLPSSATPKVALLGPLAALVLGVWLVADFDSSVTGLQYHINETWIKDIGASYQLGIDGISLPLILLTTVVFFAATVAANMKQWERPKLFYIQIGLAQSAVLGALCAQDLLLFIVFFDLMLVPFYFLVGMWGQRNPIAAVTKLVIYTLVGSLLMLVGVIAVAVLSSGSSMTFSIPELTSTYSHLDPGTQKWIFLCFAAAFLIKMPIFPLHGWMPDGYRAMPIPVLIMFSAVLSKIAAYGFIRIVLPVLPDASIYFQQSMLVLGVISVIYGSVMAFSTKNVRLIVGYSSLAQLGFILIGIFTLNQDGVQGAVLQMFNHGLVVAPLLLIVGLVARSANGSEELSDLGGIGFKAPLLATLFLIVAFANLALPGSANFVGEFLILYGLFTKSIALAVVASVGVVLASVYMLRAFIRSMHNREGSSVDAREISFKEAAIVTPLIAVILAVAIYPQFMLKRSDHSSEAALTNVQISRSTKQQILDRHKRRMDNQSNYSRLPEDHTEQGGER